VTAVVTFSRQPLSTVESMENESGIFTYKGCPIHYRLVGPAGAPLVALTHGGMVDHRVWDMQVPALSARYRLLLWDVRGHGRSRPGGRNRTIPQIAGDLAALLDHLGQRRSAPRPEPPLSAASFDHPRRTRDGLRAGRRGSLGRTGASKPLRDNS
jgi:alpha-beta hydrolase superfamily lysophospholipase